MWNWWYFVTTDAFYLVAPLAWLYNSQALLEGINLMLYNIIKGILVILMDVTNMYGPYLSFTSDKMIQEYCQKGNHNAYTMSSIAQLHHPTYLLSWSGPLPPTPTSGVFWISWASEHLWSSSSTQKTEQHLDKLSATTRIHFLAIHYNYHTDASCHFSASATTVTTTCTPMVSATPGSAAANDVTTVPLPVAEVTIVNVLTEWHHKKGLKLPKTPWRVMFAWYVKGTSQVVFSKLIACMHFQFGRNNRELSVYTYIKRKWYCPCQEVSKGLLSKPRNRLLLQLLVALPLSLPLSLLLLSPLQLQSDSDAKEIN